jgi:hypothetical protein
MPQSQLMNLRVNPGAARYLGERAREGTEAAIMPVLRSQTENPNLRPEAVYGAMLGDPAQNIAGAAATYAVRPGGGDVFTDPDYDIAGFRKKARESLMDTLYDEEIERENLAIGEIDAISKDPFLDVTDKYQLPLEMGLFTDSPFAQYQEAFNFIQSPLFNEKANKYITQQYGSPNDPLYKAYMRGEYDIAPAQQIFWREQFANDEVEKIIALRERQHELLNSPEDPNAIKDPYTLDRDQELASIEYELTSAYDGLTPFRINMGAGTLGARLQNDVYRADLVDRLIDFERGKAAEADRDMGGGYLDYFNRRVKETNAVDRLDEQLKKLGVYFTNNATDDLIADTMQEGKVKTRFMHPVFLTKEYGIDLSDLHAVPRLAVPGGGKAPIEHYAEGFKRALDQQLIDEIQSKVEEQGGIFTGAFTRLSRNYNTPLENVGAIERGRATLTPGKGLAPIDFKEVVEYLAKTPRKDYENKTFPEIVLAAHKADFYKDIKSPIKIAQRADAYQALTPEQRFTGTVPWSENLSPTYFDDMKGSALRGAQWREINSRGGIKIEGRLLRHCLSLNPTETSAYERKFQAGKARYFSLRDKKGKSYATIEMEPDPRDGLYSVVAQIKGRGNSAVGEKYATEIEAFLDEYQRRELKTTPLTFTEDRDFIPPKYRSGLR